MKKMTMKKYVVTVCQEVKYMIVCAALLLAFFTTVNAAEKEAPEKIIRVGALGDTFNYVTENGIDYFVMNLAWISCSPLKDGVVKVGYDVIANIIGGDVDGSVLK